MQPQQVYTAPNTDVGGKLSSTLSFVFEIPDLYFFKLLAVGGIRMTSMKLKSTELFKRNSRTTRAANKEHRNVSDYTPLSLATSGGYVNIIRLLLAHAAEINSRTGSKLGISPLMLAAMNGHVAAVKTLLEMGSDINAQIETNRNTALTLACFQGRHEVVQLLFVQLYSAWRRRPTWSIEQRQD